ncbi:hypothetical protein Y032_0499g2557 [Ancylostoma ceylanicum]|uniref:Uncharacterized protein n=1 Tax=Ancylostoma ceylanicum TaxID=53326 RepID=A0A016WVD2_9BILA|nr:hypothetical protein Y032_0499g2557 [Ancylostoma ceylanicum]
MAVEEERNAMATEFEGPRVELFVFFTYSELQTVVGMGRDRGTGTLVVFCTEAMSLLGRDTEENRVVIPAPAYDCLEFTSLLSQTFSPHFSSTYFTM